MPDKGRKSPDAEAKAGECAMTNVTGVDEGEPKPRQAGSPATTQAESQPPAGQSIADQKMEGWRSGVRIWVTYMVTAAYVIASLYLIFWLTLEADKVDLAIGVFAGLSSVATGVIGFWFGNRKAIRELSARPPSGAE